MYWFGVGLGFTKDWSPKWSSLSTFDLAAGDFLNESS
jgi:hypothetical protein